MSEISKIYHITKYTFIEIYKGKILYNVLLLGLGLVALTYVASEFTYGVPARVALDFGLGALYLSSVGIALFLGANLISKEIENRTVYMILSRPLSRSAFLIGRVLGMAGIILLNNIILSLLTLIMYFNLDGTYESLIGWSILFSFFESLLVLIVVVFFSMISNTVITILSAMSIYVFGHGLDEALSLFTVKSNPVLQIIIKWYSYVFPNFSKLNIKQFVLYDQPLEQSYLVGVSCYVIVYTLALLLASCLIFERKNLD